MKKFFCCLLSFFIISSTFCFVGCSSNEIDKISKNLTAYSFNISLNDETKTIEGTEIVDYINDTENDLEFLCLHLYPRAFREGALVRPYTTLTNAVCFPNGISFGDINIVSVKVDGEIKPFSFDGDDEDILKIDFGFKLTPNKRLKIEIKFTLTIPNCTHRFGYYETNINLGNWYPIICVYKNGEFDKTPYYATGDPFCSEIANYDIVFRYPKQYQICASGNVDSEILDSEIESKISAKAVRDFAICLSSSANIKNESVNGINIQYMCDEKDTETSKFLQISCEAVEFFNNSFGNYPYKTLSVVKTPFIYGGMEYPGLVMISSSIDDEEEFLKVIVHEIAHQWWYAVVGNDETHDAWLDESLSEYSTALFFESKPKYNISYSDFVNNALSSYLLYVDVIKTLKGDVNTKMNLPVNEYQNDYEYSYMVYVKGVIMFDSLKSMVGEKKLVAGLKKYYSLNKFKIASKQEFFSAFKSACHKDLDGFFDGYLNGTTIISQIN